MENPSSMPDLNPPQPQNGVQVPKPEPQVDVLIIRNHNRTCSSTSSLSSTSELNTSLPSSLLLNVSALGSDDDAGSSGGSNSNASTLVGGPNCDEDLKSSCNKDQVARDINKEPSKQPLRYAVMRKKSLDQKWLQQNNNNHDNTLGLTVHLVKAPDEVDKGLPRPDPEGQTESSGNSASSPTQDELEPTLTAIDITTSPAFKKLEIELQSARQELQLKEKEVDKLSKIRDEVETELQDLTASLFQEAHRMVGEANVKRASTEKSLTEATMKIDGLETEVTALKALVLTSAPSQPNRHLHPQIETKSSHKKLSFGLSKNKSPAGSTSSLTNGVVVGAGGINGVEPLNDSSVHDESHSNFCSMGSGCDNSCGFFEEKNIDPDLRKQYLTWKKSPTLERKESEFLDRLYREDIDPCLDFPARDDTLKDLVLKSIHDQTICIRPLKADKNELVKDCPLLNSSRVLCKYHVRIADCSGDGNKGKDFCISQLARNRITAVCNLLNYLDYIKKGLVKSHTNDVYWEIMQLRKRIVLAKLGFSPD